MCGIHGAHGHVNGKYLVKRSLWSVHTRGRGSVGVAVRDATHRRISIEKRLENDLSFYDTPQFLKLEGKTWIGHVRWPTQSEKSTRNAQPHYTQHLEGRIALAANGDVVNMDELKRFLEEKRIRVYSENDAEVMTAVIYHHVSQGMNIPQAIAAMMKMVRGAYSAVLIADWEDALFAFRDEYGIRPMFLGTLDNRYIVCSETCQLTVLGASYVREIEPGEIVKIDDDGLHSFHRSSVENPDVIKPQFFCTIEGAYFSRPDSTFPVIGPDGKLKFVSFYMIRKALGRRTAIEHPVPHADMVIPVPRSGIPAAIGYSHEAKIPYESALINEGQIGRTFIESDYQARVRLADEKYSGVPDMFEEKRVVVIDDSLIRALTMKTIIQKLRDLGALEVHVRIPAPEVILSCYYGVDTKRAFELVAHDKNKEELRLAAGAPDSLEFISKKGFREVLSVFHPRGLCMACFDGKYPIPVK